MIMLGNCVISLKEVIRYIQSMLTTVVSLGVFSIILIAIVHPYLITSNMFGLLGLKSRVNQVIHNKNSIFDFEVETIAGELVSLSKYKGKSAYLIVNVASQ